MSTRLGYVYKLISYAEVLTHKLLSIICFKCIRNSKSRFSASTISVANYSSVLLNFWKPRVIVNNYWKCVFSSSNTSALNLFQDISGFGVLQSSSFFFAHLYILYTLQIVASNWVFFGANTLTVSFVSWSLPFPNGHHVLV